MLVKRLILAGAVAGGIAGLSAAAGAAPLGGAGAAEAIMADAQSAQSIENVRWVCRYNWRGQRHCYWAQPRRWWFSRRY